MWTVFKKELKSYFLSPIGYTVIGIFLLCFSVFFYQDIFSSGSVDLGYLYFAVAMNGLIIIAPILTMRMFAEEKKTGTDQLILTSPVGVFKIVLGKLLAALFVIIVTLILSLIYWGIISFFGKINIMSSLIAVLGFILISMAILAFGMFASSITENQIIAAIITIVFLVISILVGNINIIFSGFNLINFYLPFAKGIISIESGILLILFTILFITLTIIVLKRRKLVR